MPKKIYRREGIYKVVVEHSNTQRGKKNYTWHFGEKDINQSASTYFYVFFTFCLIVVFLISDVRSYLGEFFAGSRLVLSEPSKSIMRRI